MKTNTFLISGCSIHDIMNKVVNQGYRPPISDDVPEAQKISSRIVGLIIQTKDILLTTLLKKWKQINNSLLI